MPLLAQDTRTTAPAPARLRTRVLGFAAAGAALLAVLPASAPARTGAVAELSCVAPTDAAAIDGLLSRASSPLAGEGAIFVSEGVAAGIDPRVLVAIAAHETGLETYAPARAIHNPFGLGPGMSFSSDAASIARAARTLGAYYVKEGRIRLSTIGPKWAPIGAANDPTGLNRNWISGVSGRYAALGGDPDRPILLGSQRGDAACSAATSITYPIVDGPSAEKASGPSTVAGWGGAALMLLSVLGLTLRRRALSAGGRPADAQPSPDDPIALAQAQTAATMAPADLPETDDPAREIVLAEWETTVTFAPVTAPEADAGTGDGADTDTGSGFEIYDHTDDPPEGVWPVWFDSEPMVLSAPGITEPAPADDDPISPPDPEPAPVYATVVWPELHIEVVVEPAPEPEPEPEPLDEAPLDEQAATVADVVPALLNGLVPLGAVCDHPGVTPRMLALMRILADTPLGVADQAGRLGVSRTIATDLSARLVSLGLAEREPDPGSRRRTRVVLTGQGYRLCADTAASPDPSAVEAVLARMSPAERAHLLSGLQALATPAG
jgi:DNA-binding MarR family transcriptional regulator